MLSRFGLGLGGLTRGQGVGYAATLAAFRAFLAANASDDNPHSLPAMASPPTIRTNGAGTSGAPASPDTGLTVQYLYGAGAGILAANSRLYGGKPATAGTFYRGAEEATVLSSGNITSTTSGYSHRQTIKANASKFAWRVRGLAGGLGYRFIVADENGENGQFVSFTKTTTPGGGREYLVNDFGLSAWRTHTIECELSGGIEGFHVAVGDLVELPAVPTTFGGVVLSDSFGADTGATFSGDGFSNVAGDYLGTLMPFGAGVSGSGYVATAGGTVPALGARLAAELNRYIGVWGQPTFVVVPLGINDIGQSGIQAAAEAVFNTIRSMCPAALVFVVGPWDVNAPSPPVANYATCKSAIQAAVGTRGGFWFFDPEGLAYTKSDSTHPDTAGHLLLGEWLNDQIRAAVAA